MSKKDSLGDRMKTYESVPKLKLIRRMPVIIRLDGKAFHTWTKGCNRPFDHELHNLMVETTIHLCENIQGCVLAYTQSDEISLLLKDWTNINTDAWFKSNVQKMVSVAAAYATGYFNSRKDHYFDAKPLAYFDARAFNIPKEDVNNYFIWRQQDATRNSVQMLGQSLFSHKQLQGKSNSDLQDMMMLEKGINWNDLDVWKKRGTCTIKYELPTKPEHTPRTGWVADEEIPIFTQDRAYVEDLL